MTSPRAGPLHVVVVGGGIAALELVLALHDLAGDRVRVTMIAPEPEFELRPLVVARSFSRGRAATPALADVMAELGGTFVRSAVQSVDAENHVVTLVRGERLRYDVLVLAHGAATVRAYDHVLTIGDHPTDLGGMLSDLEEGWSRSAAFVVPAEASWPLPLYELALMTAESVWSMGMDRVDIHLVTPEREPLGLFGAEASAEVAWLLSAARITVHLGVEAEVEVSGCVTLGRDGERLVVDRIVALPVLEGRTLVGVPCTPDGFIEVDDVGRLALLHDVYAVGDATDRPVKQGGLACEQADVAAAHIAARAGAPCDVPALEQILEGRLMTGGADRFLRRGSGSTPIDPSPRPLWWPTKVSGRYLSAYLTATGVVRLADRPSARPGIEAAVSLTWQQQRDRPDILGLSTLGSPPRL